MDILTRVMDVFDLVADWIVEAVSNMTPLFYTAPSTTGGEGSLTFLGVLAVAGLAFSVIFLIIGIIQNFLHFRG